MSLKIDNQLFIERVQSEIQFYKRENKNILPEGKIEEIVNYCFDNIKDRLGAETLDIDRIKKELRTKYTVSMIEEAVSLHEKHEPWITQKIKDEWKFFRRFKENLNYNPNISDVAVEKMDTSTNEIMDFLVDPNLPGPWDKRGMVKGYVQSGKTMSYCGLINKALDVGYRFIIVLSGRANDLRAQTQMRIDADVIGLDSEAKSRNEIKYIGVGEHNDEALRKLRVNTATTILKDFNKQMAIQNGLRDPGKGFILVMKKNVSILRNTLNFIQQNWPDPDADVLVEASDKNDNTELKSIDLCPLLLIDDESDDSSVDTREGVLINDQPDPDHDPTRTNEFIRKILHSFKRKCYVGYTATPYANVFIHHRGFSNEVGDDLFPRDFIYSLPRPDNYVGPSTLFPGNYDPEHKSLVVNIEDFIDYINGDNRIGWMPPKHRTSHIPKYNKKEEIPPSLQEAIYSFLIASAGKNLRKTEEKNNTMLINVTAWVNVHNHIRKQVDEFVILLKRSINNEPIEQPGSKLSEIKKIWENQFLNKLDDNIQENYRPLSWEEISENIYSVINNLEILQLSGNTGDILDYKNNIETGINVIVIGGHKLSRGLTLQGLSTSYFLRAPNVAVHDTIMQMGRWFGYRAGYLDLCRIYTNTEMSSRFADFAEAEEEFTEKLRLMKSLKLTPKEFGLSIEQSIEWMITARNKSRAAEEIVIDFNGGTKSSRWISSNQQDISDNKNNFLEFYDNLNKKYSSNFTYIKNHQLYKNITSSDIVTFLSKYKDSNRSTRSRSQFLIQYIEERNDNNELRNWSVIIYSQKDDKNGSIRRHNKVINFAKRTNQAGENEDFNVGTIKTKGDTSIDLEENEERSSDHGLLIIKIIKAADKDTDELSDELIAPLIIFPISNDPSPGKRVLANSVEQELFTDNYAD